MRLNLTVVIDSNHTTVLICVKIFLAGSRSRVGAGESGVQKEGRKVSIRMKARRTPTPQNRPLTALRPRRWQLRVKI